MKLRWAIALLTPFLLAANPQPKQIQPIQKCADQTVKTLDKLVLKNDGQAYTVKKNEKEGIRDLRDIVYSVPLEGSWIYLPSKELWYGITEKAMKNTSHAHEGCARELLKNNKEIEFYHTHDFNEEMLDLARRFFGFIDDYCDCFSEVTGQALYNTWGILPIIPSDGDLRKMIYKSIGYQTKYNEIKISHKIASPHGITAYYLTERGFNYLKSQSNIFWRESKGDRKKFRKLIQEEANLIVDLSANRMLISKIGIYPRDDMGSEEHIKKAVKAMSNDFFTVEFTPYSSILP